MRHDLNSWKIETLTNADIKPYLWSNFRTVYKSPDFNAKLFTKEDAEPVFEKIHGGSESEGEGESASERAS